MSPEIGGRVTLKIALSVSASISVIEGRFWLKVIEGTSSLYAILGSFPKRLSKLSQFGLSEDVITPAPVSNSKGDWLSITFSMYFLT